jgi:UDP-N-acetylmuramoyl-L-alanyl-D-glutamate--2,6-diaminopimelate ligase
MLIKLENLITELKVNNIDGNLTTDVAGIAYDSRKVEAGYVFVAITGFETDGHQYIDEAIANGANVILAEQEIEQQEVTVIQVDDTRAALAQISAKFYDYPADELTVIGVTGTNGKTTTTYLIEGILSSLGLKTGLVGTIKNKVGSNEESSSRTTPESLDLQRMFAEMLADGVTHVVMEVSSHALALDRVLGIDFDRKVFTNLSRDHLGFHESFEQYLNAKLKLFKSNDKPSIINVDDSRADKMADEISGTILTYGIEREADFSGSEIEINAKGVQYNLLNNDTSLEIDLQLTGKFNVYNSLAAISTVVSMGYDLAEVKEQIEEISGVPGRFETINAGQDYGVIVDYAHTPDGMKNVLETAAAMDKNRLIVLFGCGGDRDRSKRPAMASLAEKYADYTIVSNDNPRSENQSKIFSEIKVGFSEEFKAYEIIADRKKAIEYAIKMAKKNDLVLLLGRGHEKYQILNNKKIKLDDRQVAYQAAAEVKGI